MGVRGGQAPQLPMITTSQRNGSWGSQGKRYPLKERFRNQWGGYGKQYGASNERKGYQTNGTQSPDRGTAHWSQKQSSYVPTWNTRVDRMVMGEMERKMIKRSIEILELVRKVIAMKRVIQKTLMSLR